MNVRDRLIEAIEQALHDLNVDFSLQEIHLERPANTDHGDWSTNIALATAKNLNRNPRDLASEIAVTLEPVSYTHLTLPTKA